MSHTVTVTASPASPHIAFACTAGDDAKCRHYRNADDWGAPEVHQDRCWIATWFDDPEACAYVGDDAVEDARGYSYPPDVDRVGEISVLYCEDYIEWSFDETPGSEEITR